MADTEKKQGGGPQAMLRGLLVVVAIAVIAVVGVMMWHRQQGPLEKGTGGSQQVAMLDSEAIYALPEFTKTKKELEELTAKREAELTKTIKDKKLGPEESESLRVQMREVLRKDYDERVTPLNRRVTASIAALARERGYKVVLDKRIVVTGVTDVTEDVKKKVEEMKSADLPKDAETADVDSSVGYVNQELIENLQIYRTAQAKIYAEAQKLATEFQKRIPGKSPAEIEKMRQDMLREVQEKQAETMKPIVDRVKNVITEVGKEKGLSLVLDSHHIMWGGRNLTDDVIKKLI